MTDRAPYRRTVAVLVACVALAGAPAYAATWFAAMLVLHPLLAHAVSLVVAATVGLEATGVWLHGWERLQRGIRIRRILRHAVLLVPVGSAVFWGILVGVGGHSSFASGDAEYYAVVPALEVGAVLVWVVWRSAVAYRVGRRGSADGTIVFE